MTNYRNYSIEDLLLDDSFVYYCLETREDATAQWELWLQQNPDQAPKLLAARKLLFSLGVRLSKEEKQAELEKLKEAVRSLEVKEELPYILPVSAWARWRYAAMVAAACLLFFAGYQWSRWQNTPEKPAAALAFEIFRSGNGERKTVELADGTVVLLNSNSLLRIPLDYDRRMRVLDLEGEALFDVAHNPEKPLRVNARNMEVQALGTEFRIRSYAFEPFIQTSLLEGSVRIRQHHHDKSAIILKPGERWTLSGKDSLPEVQPFDREATEQWRQGRLVFRHASLEQLQQILQDWYGMEVILQGKPREISFNGEFLNKELDDVLSAIGYVNNFSYQINDKQITIISP